MGYRRYSPVQANGNGKQKKDPFQAQCRRELIKEEVCTLSLGTVFFATSRCEREVVIP
jgi:hypothetical protein